MATSKTLKPTNVTIAIPEFTDQPDQRVNSNCIDKLSDAVNTLNDRIKVLTGTASFIATQKNVTLAMAVGEAASNFDWVAMLSTSYSGVNIGGVTTNGNNISVYVEAALRRASETYGGYGVSAAFDAGVVAVGIRK